MFAVIGTISHEYGHIIVAKSFGYETTLHYGSMNYLPKGYLEDEDVIAVRDFTKDYANIEYDSWPNSIKEKVEEYNNVLQKRYWSEKSNSGLLVTVGGPLQTTLTGTIGLLILIWRRKSIYKNGLKALDWIAIFLSLFWLREIFNLITSIGGELISPNGTWFGGDELHISQSLNLWSGTMPLILATIGTVIAIYVVFRIIPKKIRLTFILSGFIGGIAGFILWMNIIGPKILP
ncbi:hypothetical protein [Lacinutrix sp. WUR7]|uniref:hypothetical protein n=1 Tax=Lacinutrix sp. WUR7 TaxID=2653681 RepID=UPI001EF018B6|nr:hypothetical protein [Lacinutrix sp. WUR7]